MFRVKICGLTRVQDVRWAADQGADAMGFQMSLGPRKLTPEAARRLVRAVPPLVVPVGVFYNEPLGRLKRLIRFCGFQAVQLHGKETPAYCAQIHVPILKSARMKDKRAYQFLRAYEVAAYLLDSYNEKKPGGTGKTFHFEWARAAGQALPGPVLLAGGLTPSNIQEAVRRSGAFGVDVSSGVESRPGVKDPLKVSQFIRLAKRALQK